MTLSNPYTHLIGNPSAANAEARRLVRACLRGNGPMSLGSALRVAKRIEELGGNPPAPTYRIEGGRFVSLRLGRAL